MRILQGFAGLVLAATAVAGLVGALAAVEPTAPLSLVMLSSASLDMARLPSGWQLRVKHGTPDLASVEDGDNRALRFKSQDSSFAMERAVDVDINRYPVLTWKWKVSQLPVGGDFRHAATDDQAAQVLVAFVDHRILSYIWDTSAPKGAFRETSPVPLLRIFALVCQSGSSSLNQWTLEAHNVVQDYQKAFNRPPSNVKGIRLQINTQHTDSAAESYFSDVAFQTAR